MIKNFEIAFVNYFTIKGGFEMDPLAIARLQFASTTIFHYFFVPVSIGLALIIAIMQTLYLVKGKSIYKDMTKFWGTLFLINFAVGVVTGILQEFQFGMNWSTYSRFVGDVFGPSLAIEGLLAFFMESTFIGLWVFGWDRLPKRIHLLCIWLVSLGTILSAFWILSANAFMQSPVGYEMAADGRAQMTSISEILLNPQLWIQFPHTLFAAFATGGFLIAGISAWKLAKGHNVEQFKKSFKIAIIVATMSSFLTIAFGHQQAQHIVESQPMKLAAAEALWQTSGDPAPFNLFSVIDRENEMNKFEIKIPGMLSFFSFNKFSGQIEGIQELQTKYEDKYGPGNYIPHVPTVFWSFRTMVISGTAMFGLGVLGWFLSMKDRLINNRFYLKIMVFAIALPFISNTAGWMMTEIGRQPWVVFGLMKTADAVSPTVTVGEVLFSFITFSSLYAILAAVAVYLYVRHIKKEDHTEQIADTPEDPFEKEGVDNES